MKRVELLIVAAASFVVLAIFVAPLSTPYWWDAGAVYAPGAKWLLDHGFDARPGIFPSDLSRGHTPLFYLVLAGSFRLFGAGPVAGHLLAFGWAWMAMVYTYALGRQLFGWPAGVVALLLLTTPLFLTMSSEALPEMALTALTAASFHALARGRIAETALWGTLLVLMKETGVACPLAVAGAVAIEGIRSGAAHWARRTALALAPVFVLAAFFVAQKHAEGWFFLPYHAGLFHEPHSLLEQLGHVGESIFVTNGRIVALVAAIALALFRRGAALGPSDERRREVFIAFGLHAIMNLGFFAKMFFLDRYVLPVHVSVVVMLGGLLVPAAAPGVHARARIAGLVAALLSVGAALSRKSAGSDMASGETTFQYLHAVHAYSKLYGRLEAQGGDPVVLTDWPVTDALRQPFLGWVSRPFRCVHIGDETTEPVDRVIAVQGLGSYERLRRKAQERGFSQTERIEDGAAAIELWGR